MKNGFVRIILCTAFSLLVCLTSSACLPLAEQNVYDSVIRLHVIANSNGDADQNIKLAVRDAVLEKAKQLFDGVDYDEAEIIAKQNLKVLEETANAVLSENGFDYKSTATLEYEEFPTRDYGDASLPRGRYNSLCLRLGEADGENWWCIMFPPLCNGAAKSLNDLDSCGDTNVFTASKKPRFRLKFFLLELFN